MDKKQSFFSTLKQEVIRGLSPSRSRSRSTPKNPNPADQTAPQSLLFSRRRKDGHSRTQSMDEPIDPTPALLLARLSAYRPSGEALAPLMEGPDGDAAAPDVGGDVRRERWGSWMRGQLARSMSVTPSSSIGRCDLRLLLGVMGAPLAPVHVTTVEPLPHLSIKDTPIETSSAQYILQQYTAASGGLNLQRKIHNSYAMGKVRMVASEFETPAKLVKNRSSVSRGSEQGSFVLWQMSPDMWYVELAVGGSKVHAGSNGKLVWRHTPWLGAHAAKGPVRPLRRSLQGLDPLTTATMFANARCIGEKKIRGEDCFILKLSADAQTLKARSEGPAEIIRHALFGYFSQRTGLLVLIEDSHLTRIQKAGGDAVYWETTINSFLDDYRPVEGMMIAHSGRSVVTLFRFGEAAMSHTKTRLEETWTVEEVAFNVPGLSIDCFIPPADLRCGSIGETNELLPRGGERTRNSIGHGSKIAALEKAENTTGKMVWKIQV